MEVRNLDGTILANPDFYIWCYSYIASDSYRQIHISDEWTYPPPIYLVYETVPQLGIRICAQARKFATGSRIITQQGFCAKIAYPAPIWRRLT